MCATPNFEGPRAKGAVTTESSSQLDQIAKDIDKEAGNDYSDDDDDEDDDNTANKITTKSENQMENQKNGVQGREANNKEMVAKNGTDYVMGMGMMMGGMLAAGLAGAGALGAGGLALKKIGHHKKPVHRHNTATGAEKKYQEKMWGTIG